MSNQEVELELPEQLRIRREKRERILESGKEAYPVSVPRTKSLADIRAKYVGLETDTATRDVEFRGQKIREGDRVVLWYVSANRDESVIETPDRFIVDRPKPHKHLSFGAGIHRCVGDRLATLQLRVLWEEILRQKLVVDVAGKPERQYSNFIRGFNYLPVQIRR